jgi:hypothetical protein
MNDPAQLYQASNPLAWHGENQDERKRRSKRQHRQEEWRGPGGTEQAMPTNHGAPIIGSMLVVLVA